MEDDDIWPFPDEALNELKYIVRFLRQSGYLIDTEKVFESIVAIVQNCKEEKERYNNRYNKMIDL